jgi:hypothetical protein
MENIGTMKIWVQKDAERELPWIGGRTVAAQNDVKCFRRYGVRESKCAGTFWLASAAMKEPTILMVPARLLVVGGTRAGQRECKDPS